MAASADLTLTEARVLSLRDLRVDLGGNSVRGAMDVILNGTPRVNAKLDVGTLDLTGLTDGPSEASGSAGGSAGGETGWDRSPIDASGLSAFNGEIGVQAASVDLGAFKLGQTRALLTNDRSRMVFALREVRAYDGLVTGEFVMNNRNGLSVGGKLNAQGVGIQSLLSDAVGVDKLTGTGDAQVQFLGVGNSLHAIMHSLSGQGGVQIGRGTIEGIDLDRLIRSGDAGPGTTVFDALSMSFNMDGGSLFNKDLLLKLASYEARGDGRIGLGAQDIDYTITPVALNANSGNGIAIPVRIRGPWADPKIRPDLEAAIDLNFAAEKEALKDKADQALKEKVAEELGITATDRQSLKDAAKDKLEEEVLDGLRKLFD